jgi:hypothetical protein
VSPSEPAIMMTTTQKDPFMNHKQTTSWRNGENKNRCHPKKKSQRKKSFLCAINTGFSDWNAFSLWDDERLHLTMQLAQKPIKKYSRKRGWQEKSVIEDFYYGNRHNLSTSTFHFASSRAKVNVIEEKNA